MENAVQSSRNQCLDFLKGIACILVLFIHSSFPGVLGEAVQSNARFCMPFFFMVSGYFAYHIRGEKDKERRLSKIRHIGVITASASLFYLLVAAAAGDLYMPGMKAWARFLLLNQPNVIAGQMWFLYAMLYVYLVWAIIDKFDWYRFVYIAAGVLFVCYLLLAQGAYFAGISVPPVYYRNFLFLGIPGFFFGHWIHRNQERINISDRVLIWIAVISTVLCPVERLLMGRVFGVQLCSHFQVVSLFLLAIQNPSFGGNRKLTKFGRDYSLLIYVFQFFIIRVVQWGYAHFRFDNSIFLLYLQPIVVLIGTALISVGFLRLKLKIIRNISLKRQVKT